jgi:hypothetical protein
MINQKWIFGNKAGLDFSTPIPTSMPSSANIQINTSEGCASISDANGQLLLYTDGSKLWDGANNLRASGSAAGLDGNPSSTQSAIIVPDPGNNQRYYIFTADGASGNNLHVNGLRIDTSNWTSAPLASLLTMPVNTNRSATERITAIQHANCVDFWVLTIVQNTSIAGANTSPGIFRLFLVNSLGVQYLGETPMGVNVSDLGYLKGSPDGRRLGLADFSNALVRVYDFDNALGVINLSTVVTINVPASALNPPVAGHPRSPYGIEFSPNNKVFYFSLLGAGGTTGTNAVNNGYVFQVDLTTSTPVPLQVVVYPNPAGSIGYAVGALQLGMDGRIYVAKHNETTVGAILSPNTIGVGTAGCNPQMGYITLVSGSCNLGLPNLIPNKCPCACEAGPCEADITAANQILSTRAGLKQFMIPANGQTLPTTCNLAFENVNFGPVFTLKWGDGPSDQFESSDLEVLYILVHNPYRNLIYRDLIIFDITITPNQTLPGGDDSVRIIPAEIACFEEVQPCSYVARDFALIIDHALVGAYQISFKYCIGEIGIVSGSTGAAAFNINIVAS